MKSLIWKEWREIRFVPISIALLCAVANIVFVSRQVELVAVFGAALLCLSAILSGGGMFSREVGRGTLGFLTSLPVSRRSVWLAKFYAGLLSILAAVISALTIGVTANILRFGWSEQRSVLLAEQLQALTVSRTSLCYYIILPILTLIGCYAISLLISVLVDRTLNSVILSVIACIVVPVIVVLTVGTYAHYFRYADFSILQPAIVCGTVLCTLFASYYTFVHGDTLRTPRRFLLTTYVIGGWAISNAVAIIGLHLITKNGL